MRIAVAAALSAVCGFITWVALCPRLLSAPTAALAAIVAAGGMFALLTRET